MAIFSTFLFKYISIFGSFGVRSGPVRDPFGARPGPVRANFGPKFSEPKISKFQKFSIVTLREAKRGSAGVLVPKCEAAGDTQSVQEMNM